MSGDRLTLSYNIPINKLQQTLRRARKVVDYIVSSAPTAGVAYFNRNVPRSAMDLDLLADCVCMVIDVETTGLDPISHEVIQIGAVVITPDLEVRRRA